MNVGGVRKRLGQVLDKIKVREKEWQALQREARMPPASLEAVEVCREDALVIFQYIMLNSESTLLGHAELRVFGARVCNGDGFPYAIVNTKDGPELRVRDWEGHLLEKVP